MAIVCPHCDRKDGQVKAGMAGAVQRYKCRSCGRRYSLEARPREYPAGIRERALQAHAAGASARQVARELGVSAQTVSIWVRTAMPAEAKTEDPISLPAAEQTRRARTTIADVAQHAGVSTSTVSNFLNDKGRMSPETRRRIDEAIKALYFTPSALVRSIRSRRTHTLGLVSYGIYDLDHNVEWSVVAPLLAAINRAADRANYDVLLYTGWPHRSRSHTGSDFLNGQIDGLLWVSPKPNVAQLRYVAAAGLPVMALLTSRVPDGVGFVVADNVAGERDLVSYLADRRHRRIALLGSGATNDFVERAAGYRAGLDAAGLPLDPTLQNMELPLPWSPQDVTPILERWLDLPEPPTAIIAIEDGLAALTINALRERGVRVPDDIAVAGFNNLPATEHFCGGITTVRQSFPDIGRTAVERLDALIHGAPLAQCRVTIPVNLVIRASTESNNPTPSSPDIDSGSYIHDVTK